MTTTAQPLIPVLKRRVRALTYLAGATGFAVLLAAIALTQRASTGEPDFKPVRMFASLEKQVENVAAIQIETKTASFNVVRDAQGLWTLPDKAKYPADFNTVRKTILGLAKLDLVAEKTNRADWQEKLGLGLPKTGGSGTLVTLKDGKGEVMATLIAGTSAEGEAAGGRQAIYVRRPSEPQTYVARGTFAATTGQVQWLDKSFVDLARDRIKTVAMKPFKGRPYTVAREKPEDAAFRIVEAIPAGRQLRTETEPNGIGNALLGISFDDVKPLSLIDFANAASFTAATFDGLNVVFKIVEQDRDYWIAIEATANPTVQPPPTKPGATQLKPDVPKEAKEINALAGGWAYKIPRYKGTLMTAPLEDLLRPIGGG
ncbi:MAG: DUF4340 domain-containing protein [Micropepsaceae bacterium]